MYVLLTNRNKYFVEYLIGSLILSDSIEKAMLFNDNDTAQKFKQMLYQTCEIKTTVQTFIP